MLAAGQYVPEYRTTHHLRGLFQRTCVMLNAGDAIVGIISTAHADGEDAIPVDTAHLADLRVLVHRVVLYNTESIDPQVTFANLEGQFDGVSDGFGYSVHQRQQGTRLCHGIVIVFEQPDLLNLAPSVAQSHVSDIVIQLCDAHVEHIDCPHSCGMLVGIPDVSQITLLDEISDPVEVYLVGLEEQSATIWSIAHNRADSHTDFRFQHSRLL